MSRLQSRSGTLAEAADRGGAATAQTLTGGGTEEPLPRVPPGCDLQCDFWRRGTFVSSAGMHVQRWMIQN